MQNRGFVSKATMTALLVTAFAAGCSAPSGDDTTDTSEGAASSAGARSALAACDATYAKQGHAAFTTADTENAALAYRTCLQKVTATLVQDKARQHLSVDAPVAAYRDASTKLCVLVSHEGPSSGGSGERVDAATCAADQERTLATLLLETQFDGSEPTFSHAAFAFCEAAFENEAKGARTNADMTSAASNLVSCIRERYLTGVANRIATERHVDRALTKATADGVAASVASLCNAAAYEGTSPTTTSLMCQAHGLELSTLRLLTTLRPR